MDYMVKKDYDNNSIKQLKGAERVRQKPGVMFGSDNIKGAFHTFKEILGNSLDEARGGFGNTIEITYHKDGAISVRDFGRGVPMGWNEAEEQWNWHLVFNELYAGGKYDGKDDAYKYSVGLNGLGAAAVQYVSEYFIVKSYKGNKVFMKEFMEGNPLDDELYEEDLEEEQWGTYIKWKIDDKVFRNTNFKFKDFTDYCEGQAHINKVNLVLKDETSGEVIEYEGKGIEAYLIQQLDSESIVDVLNKTLRSEGKEERGQDYVTECEVCLAITEDTTSSRQFFFHNTANMSEGVHIKATQDALLGYFRNIGKQQNVTVMPYDYNDYLSIIVSSFSNITSFANQTKDGVDNPFIYDSIYKSITDLLEEEIAKGNESVEKLTNNVVNSAIARKRAKEIENQERMIRKSTKRKEKAEKYIDCKSNDPYEKELFIVEGDSALSSCKDARDGSFQALLPVRGKTLNCVKAPLKSVLSNKIIQDIIVTVGTGVDLGTGNDLFDMNKLQFDKVIIATDADVDGYQIRVLLYTVFYRLMPELLRQGKIYIAETPLFEIEVQGKKEVSRFAYTPEEKDRILEELKSQGKKVKKINRSKGLGENNPDMLWDTTMNPESRKLVQLTIDPNNEYVQVMTNMLFGNDDDSIRKGYIFEKLREGLFDEEVEAEFLQNLEEIGQVNKLKVGLE